MSKEAAAGDIRTIALPNASALARAVVIASSRDLARMKRLSW